jgi:hypothetical protein
MSDLIFYANRSTPQVVPTGAPGKPKANYGRQTHRRAATSEEEKRMKDGKWLRVDEKGRKPGHADYRGHGTNRLGPPPRNKRFTETEIEDIFNEGYDSFVEGGYYPGIGHAGSVHDARGNFIGTVGYNRETEVHTAIARGHKGKFLKVGDFHSHELAVDAIRRHHVPLREAGGASAAEYRAKAASYAGRGGGIGSSERQDIGKGKGRKYPPGFQHIRNALIRSGKSVAVASMIAYGALKRWAEGRGDVKSSTRDKARKVLGQLGAGKGKAKATAAAKRVREAELFEAALAAAEDSLAENMGSVLFDSGMLGAGALMAGSAVTKVRARRSRSRQNMRTWTDHQLRHAREHHHDLDTRIAAHQLLRARARARRRGR